MSSFVAGAGMSEFGRAFRWILRPSTLGQGLLLGMIFGLLGKVTGASSPNAGQGQGLEANRGQRESYVVNRHRGGGMPCSWALVCRLWRIKA